MGIGRSLFPDQVSCRPTEVHAGTLGNSLEDSLRHRARNFELKDSLDVLSQTDTAGSGAPGQLPMEPIRHVPHLDHLGHAYTVRRVA
jgi:hypothetical protein